MYTENYSPEEINRIKKIIEIGESQKQIKQSFWDEINTPDVLKLKEESNLIRDIHNFLILDNYKM